MPKISQKFIDRKIRRPDVGQVIYRDDELIGFGLRVTRGSMSYIVEGRVNGINKESQLVLTADLIQIPPVRKRESFWLTCPEGETQEKKRQRKSCGKSLWPKFSKIILPHEH
jgi:hypothetical protein